MAQDDPKSVAQAYLAALEAKDYEVMRGLLHDDLSFRGPMMTVGSADDFIQAVRMLGPITKRVELRKMVAEGDDVCVFYDFVTNAPIGTSRMAECYTVADGKIQSIELYFDPRPWAT